MSIWRNYEEFREINPLVKVPTLVCDDGRLLVDSALIIEYLETQVAKGRSLMPAEPGARRECLQHLGVALVAMEKSVQLIYEKQHRPEGTRHEPWIARLEQQLDGAARLLESAAAASVLAGNEWLTGDTITQADITAAVAWRFMHHTSAVDIDLSGYRAMQDFSARAEILPEFIACPLGG